jgi:hypothetical protein
MIVTTRHLFSIPGFSRRHGFCRSGSRKWARAHGIDWSDFVRNGIEAQRLEAIGDAFALALVKWARQCEARHG